jgi:hypothetical protein
MQSVAPGAVPQGLTPAAWQSISDQIAAGPYRTYPTNSGYASANPAHGWQIGYGTDGATHLTPRDATAPAWQWGLRLASYGFTTPSSVPTTPTAIQPNGQRMTYQWDGRLSEWWQNGTNGLEQGFTIQTRPTGSDGTPLRVLLEVRGDLHGTPIADGLAFQNAAGETMLTYTKLRAWDATGRSLPTTLTWDGGQIGLSVDDNGAQYPLTIDPFVQQGYLKASNTGADDEFGWSVAISGDTLVVGAPGEDSSATGVNGDQGNNNAVDAGAAYVFTRSGAIWSQQAYLKASNTGAGDNFGYSVAISGDTIVVGAWGEASNATGVNGNQADNSAVAAGADYVFTRSGTTWSQQAYLKASNTDANDQFGYSVAIFGDTIVVGAPNEASNGYPNDNSAAYAGAAYVFTRSGTTWIQQAYLKASNTGANDAFGVSVAISGDTVVVGAPYEDSNATGVGGNQTDNSANAAGAAYVFVRSGTTWSQQAYLKASNTGAGDTFGSAVAISGDTIVVGAYGEDSNTTGVNGNQTDNSASGAGAAYAFTRSGTTWSQQAYLKASNTGAGDNFGQSVAISGDTVVVGAYGESSNTTGVNGTQTDNSATNAGAAYVFDATPPSVTINQAADQTDPANSGPIRFTVVFSEDVTGFTAADVTLGGTAPGSLTAVVTGSGPTYTVSVSGMTGPGTVTATIPAGVAQDVAGNLSLASTSTDNSVTFAPTTRWVVYLPLVSTAPPQPTVIVLRDTPFPARTAQQGEVFWQRTLPIPTLASGTYVLAASADGTLPALVDDEIRLLVNGQVLFSYDFSASGQLVAAIVPLPSAVLTQIQGQTVTIELADRYGGKVEATPLYLVQRP